MKKRIKSKVKVKDFGKLKKKLDKIFSEWIRKRNGEYSLCYTCGKRLHWKELQAGHYIPRNNMATRWDERNVQTQCVGCNVFGKGKPDEFAIHLIKQYGQAILDELHRLKHTIKKWTVIDLETMIEKYK